MDAKSSSPADPRQTREFCWRYNIKHQLTTAPARYSDGSASVVVIDDTSVSTLTQTTYDLNGKCLRSDVEEWLLSKGYTPIW